MYFGHYQKGKYSGPLIAVPELFTVEAAEYIIETDAMKRAPCHLFSPTLRLALSFSNFSCTQRNPERKERLLHYVFGYAK